jgi:hypothetical protein
LTAALLFGCGVERQEFAAFRGRLLGELQRHPALEPADVYKFAHQAALGPAHAVPDSGHASQWLHSELAELTPDDTTPLVDSLSPDGRLVRVHLRPFLAAGGCATGLLRAFLATARRRHGTHQTLTRYGGYAVELARLGVIPVAADSLATLWRTMEQRDFPALEHSAEYVRLYRPAYRVIATDQWPVACPDS